MGKTTEFAAAKYLDIKDMIGEYLKQALAAGAKPCLGMAFRVLQTLGVRMQTHP